MFLCIAQARMGSSRLPGKVLLPILNRPMIGLMVDRLERSKFIDQIVIATSNDPSDDSLYEFCQKENITCFRGDAQNVLDRFQKCAQQFPSAKHIIRVTGDCPLIDPSLLDECIAKYKLSVPDLDHYLLGSPHYPRGLDAEIFPVEILNLMAKKATTDYQKEHVTGYVRQSHLFKLAFHESGCDYAGYRWCVDEKEDFELVEKIFTHLYPTNPDFTWRDILDLLKTNPELAKINNHIKQKS